MERKNLLHINLWWKFEC